MNNSFAQTRKNVKNWGCRQVISDFMAWREQICLRGEWDSAGGWDDPLNQLFADEAGRIRKTIAIVTTEKSLADQIALNAKTDKDAADESQTLLERYTQGKPLSEDDVVMPSSIGDENELPYDFSGADPNIPQVQNRKNKDLVSLVTMIDRAVKETSNLDCQGYGTTIPKSQSAMILALLDSIFVLLQQRGGEKNRRRIAQGTTATEAMADDVVGTEIAKPDDKPKA